MLYHRQGKIDSRYSVDFGAKKQVQPVKGELFLNASDIFNTMRIRKVLFFLYGVYAAATESIGKAWISNITDKRDTATAIGTYTGFQSIFTMIASTLAGWIWITFGAKATFLFSGLGALLISFYVLVYTTEAKKAGNQN